MFKNRNENDYPILEKGEKEGGNNKNRRKLKGGGGS